MQTAYEVRVALSAANLAANKLVWDSGKVASDASIQVAYAGPALQSGARYFWQIEAWDNLGRDLRWGEPGYWG